MNIYQPYGHQPTTGTLQYSAPIDGLHEFLKQRAADSTLVNSLNNDKNQTNGTAHSPLSSSPSTGTSQLIPSQNQDFSQSGLVFFNPSTSSPSTANSLADHFSIMTSLNQFGGQLPNSNLSSDQRTNNATISGMPAMPDYNQYAANLAAAGVSPNMSFGLGSAGGAGGQFMPSSSQNQQQQQQAGQQQFNSNTSPGTSSSMQFPSSNNQMYPSPGSFQQQQNLNMHQRTMSALAGLGQGMQGAGGQQQQQSQHFGAQNPSGMVGSNSAPNSTQNGAAPSPQYGMVGPAGFQPGSPTSQTNSPFLNTGLNANATSPAAQAMSAMSSMSGIPSSNTSASANTPISPATAYTPSFASPSLSQQAAFNAAAAAGLGVNFSAFGFPNMPLGGLGIASTPMSNHSISQQMSGMNLAHDGQAPPTIRTVYVGNLPGDASVDELLSQVRYGPIESVKIIPDKSCAFISFLDPSTAAAFHSDANLRKVQLHGQDLKIGWGKATGIPGPVLQAVQQHGATRNVYLGNLDEAYTEQTLRDDLSRFGHIDQVKIVRDKNIGFVHFLSISTAMKVVQELPKEAAWQGRRVNYGKDRCAYVPRNQHQQQQHNQMAAAMAHQAASQAMSPYHMSPNLIPSMSPVMSPMAFSGGFVDPATFGNRTVYLGNLHPDTTAEDVCNTVRGGILQEVRHIPDKHICFVTFVMPESALALMNTAVTQGISIKNRRLKVGWGKNNGPCPPGIAAIVAAGGSRNVYIGNIDDFETFTLDKIKADLSEFGEIEQVNLLEEKSCAFTNFMKISSAVKAIETLKTHPEYGKFKIAYGKDRVGNMARAPMGRRPQHYQRDGNQHTSNVGSPALEHGQSPVPASEGLGERALSPQLDAALQAAAAVDSVEQQQAMKL